VHQANVNCPTKGGKRGKRSTRVKERAKLAAVSQPKRTKGIFLFFFKLHSHNENGEIVGTKRGEKKQNERNLL